MNKFSLLLLAGLSVVACGDPNAAKRDLLQPRELQNDLLVLRKTLEEAHPARYWYADSTAASRAFDSTSATLNRPMSAQAFFKTLLPLVAGVRCAHTRLYPPRKRDTSFTPFRRLLPSTLFASEGKICYIAKEGIAKRHVVTSINGIRCDEVLNTLLATLPADGFNETYKYRLLNKGALAEGYALFFGQPQAFRLQLQTGETRVIPPTTREDLHAAANGEKPETFRLSFRPELSTAVLTVNSFKGNSARFRDTLQVLFRQVSANGSGTLVIDLQANGGGANDNVSTLFAFIARERFLHLKRAESSMLPLSFSRYVEKGSHGRLDKGVRGETKMDVSHRYGGRKEREPVQQYRFNGNVILLISGETLSAASEFAALFRFHRRGLLFGEETGGGYYGATGGTYIDLVLPGSGIRARIPTVWIQTAVNEDPAPQPRGRGTLPDVPVLPTGLEQRGENAAMEAALRYIAAHR